MNKGIFRMLGLVGGRAIFVAVGISLYLILRKRVLKPIDHLHRWLRGFYQEFTLPTAELKTATSWRSC